MSYSGYSQYFHSALARQIRPVGYCEIEIISGSTSYNVAESTIKQVVMKTTGDPLSRRLPTETIKIELLDYDNVWNPDNQAGYIPYLVYPLKCVVKFGLDDGNGDIDWGEEYTYYIQQAPTWKSNIATFNGVKKLSLWTMVYNTFPGRVGLNGLYQDVLATAGETYTGSLLSQFVLNTGQTLPELSVKDALLQIAVAGCGVVMSKDSDPKGAGIFIYDWTDVSNPKILSSGDMLEQPTSEFLPKIKNEVLRCYDLAALFTQTETVLEYSETFSSTAAVKRHFKLPKAIMTITESVSTSNLTLISEKRGRDSYEIEFRPNSTSNPVTINITAQPALERQSERTYIINPDGAEDEGLDCRLVNPETAQTVALYRGYYLDSTRRSYKFKYRGDPSIDIYDVMRVDLPYVGITPCIVLEHDFTYDGAFHGELLVRINGEAQYDNQSAVCGIATVGDAVCGTDSV